jgi:hypothetical protein
MSKTILIGNSFTRTVGMGILALLFVTIVAVLLFT